MKDPIEYFFPNVYYKNSPLSIFNQGLVDDLIASDKRSKKYFLKQHLI